jgi:hypothetical protein
MPGLPWSFRIVSKMSSIFQNLTNKEIRSDSSNHEASEPFWTRVTSSGTKTLELTRMVSHSSLRPDPYRANSAEAELEPQSLPHRRPAEPTRAVRANAPRKSSLRDSLSQAAARWLCSRGQSNFLTERRRSANHRRESVIYPANRIHILRERERERERVCRHGLHNHQVP